MLPWCCDLNERNKNRVVCCYVQETGDGKRRSLPGRSQDDCERCASERRGMWSQGYHGVALPVQCLPGKVSFFKSRGAGATTPPRTPPQPPQITNAGLGVGFVWWRYLTAHAGVEVFHPRYKYLPPLFCFRSGPPSFEPRSTTDHQDLFSYLKFRAGCR